MRRFLCATTLLPLSVLAFAAQEVEEPSTYRMQVSTGVGRFAGDYGQEEDTTLDVVSVNARWYFDRAELQVSVPYLRIDGGADVRWIDGQPVAIGGEDAPDVQRKESGLGDVVLRGEYYLRTGTSTSPWIIGLVRVKLPTGSESRGLGSGSTDVETGIGLVQQQGPISWLADIGYIFVGSNSGLNASNELRLGGGISMPLGRSGRNSSYVYYENRTNRFDGPDRRSIAVGASSYLNRSKRLRAAASVFFGLSNSTEDVGVYLTLANRF